MFLHIREGVKHPTPSHFGRRVRGWAAKHGIPVIYCKSVERKDKIADQHLPKDPKRLGAFLVLVCKAPALVWEAQEKTRTVQ